MRVKVPSPKTKVSYATFIGVGESAPKARQKCVVDGKQVKIPVPIMSAMGDGEG